MEPDPASHSHDRKYHADTQGDPESQVQGLGPEVREQHRRHDQTQQHAQPDAGRERQDCEDGIPGAQNVQLPEGLAADPLWPLIRRSPRRAGNPIELRSPVLSLQPQPRHSEPGTRVQAALS